MPGADVNKAGGPVILDSIRVLQVQDQLEQLGVMIKGAKALKLDPASARAVAELVQRALLVDFDNELDRETAMRVTGLSERSLLRRLHTGHGSEARWQVRDLVAGEPLTDVSEPAPEPESSIKEEHDWIERAAEEAAQAIAS